MEFMNPNIDKETIVTLKRWLENRNNNRNISDYFMECGYRSIAIFDAGEIGHILYDEIKNSEIEIKWFVDKNAEGICEIDGIPVKRIQEVFDLPEVDIVCISPIYDYEALNTYLVSHDANIRTLSLKDAVYEM